MQNKKCAISVVIPNYNGLQYIERCLESLKKQSFQEYEVIFVDNGSQDDSVKYVRENFPWVQLICLSENTGFCGAVNVGIKASEAEYVVLLNNDTEVDPDFLKELHEGISQKSKAFSGAAMMLQFQERDKIDDAGNFYNALGWAFARGKGKPEKKYRDECQIFSSCGGAAIYRRELLEELGYFDEEHFAYLEDTDLGYRARISGYENWYFPGAKVFHVGSGTSGSRYNQFKIRYSSRNNIYMIYKNMPFVQIVLNFPFFLIGFGAKLLFFALKGYGKEYAAGIKNGFSLCGKNKKYPFRWKNVGNYCKIQWQLWINIFRRFL